MPLAVKRPAFHEAVHHGSQRRIVKRQRRCAPVPGRALPVTGMQLGDEGIDANVGLQRLTPMEATEGGEQAALG